MLLVSALHNYHQILPTVRRRQRSAVVHEYWPNNCHFQNNSNHHSLGISSTTSIYK